MITNPEALQQSSTSASLSLFKEGKETITVSPSPLNDLKASGYVTVPHFLGTDKLLWDVATFSTYASAGNNIPTPFRSNDGRFNIFSYVDSSNLYIECAAESTVDPWPTFTIDVYYRVMVP